MAMGAADCVAWVARRAEELVTSLDTSPLDRVGWEIEQLLDALVATRHGATAAYATLFGFTIHAPWAEVRTACTTIVEQAVDDAREILTTRFGEPGTAVVYPLARARKITLSGDPGVPPMIITRDPRIAAAVARLRELGTIAVRPPRADLGMALALLADRGVQLPPALAALYAETDGLGDEHAPALETFDAIAAALDRDSPPELLLGSRRGAALYFHRTRGTVFDEDDVYTAASLVAHLEQLAIG